MRKKILGLVISMCLTATTVTTMAFAEDLPLAAKDTSAPETRAMVVSSLFDSENTDMNENPDVFADVTENMDCYVLINWAAQKGIISGYGDGTFKPDEKITKEQFATILYKYAVYKNYDTTQGGMSVREYDDYDDIAQWALRPVSWSVYSGLMTGEQVKDGEAYYNPKSYITQEYANSVIADFFEKNKTNPKTPAGNK